VTVYVDNWRQRAEVGPIAARWSHLLADEEEELHRFAGRLGIRRSAFQNRRHPARHHYDVTDALRARAIALGARSISWREAGSLIAARRAASAPPRP
jgi:hypothetical protein